ncbi:MAG TPA: hypothetical protein VHE78_17055 [Gemmatimonadaceae bacterium]|nr:hypothetical protein [Gemmatimonadaceae bacterium]
MPRNKDLKRLVRARMQKTGEAYTTARAQIIRKPKAHSRSRSAAAAVAGPAPASVPTLKDYAALAGISEKSVKAKTGCTWERWVGALDRLGAEKMSHGKIVELVREKYRIDDWWSQMVTVGYERIKGLRARGQRRDGTYEVARSRTFNVAVTTLFDAWADADVRRRWFNAAGVKIRTAARPKSMRLDWAGGGIIAVGFIAKGESRSVLALAHTKVPDRETADGLKTYWSERLDTLGEVLGSGGEAV